MAWINIYTFMYQNEDIISKTIVTPDGEKEFQVRYNLDESVGVVFTSNNKSYFLLDSEDYWYDLIQEGYPPILKCSCKNNRFNLTMNYTPRIGTEDFKEVQIICTCTTCMKIKKLPPIKIDYSPSSQLFTSPLTFCKQPRIKYKTYSLSGFWSKEELLNLVNFFIKKNLFIYSWYSNPLDSQKHFKELSLAELYSFLENHRFLRIYFSETRLNSDHIGASYNEDGIYLPHDIWRKNNIFELTHYMVYSRGWSYYINYCSEYLDKDGNVIPKSTSFCALTQEFKKYSKKLLKENSN